MNKNLEKLIEVNRFDLEVSKYNPIIEEKKAPLYAKTGEKTKMLKEKQDLEIKLKDNEEELERNNNELALLSADIEKIREKLRDSKSEKEVKNLGMEEEILLEKTTNFNNNIGNIEKDNQRSRERIVEIDSLVIELDKEIADIESACTDVVNDIKKKQDELSAKRQQVALQMEPTVLRLYEKIRKWAKTSSVIAIYKEACGGCFIRLSDKNIADIRKGDEIVHCPHCGRILYDMDLIKDKAE